MDTTPLERALSAIDGVRSVRINAKAASVAIEHDGRAATRQTILDRLSRFDDATLPARQSTRAGPKGLVALAMRPAILAALVVLPPPLRLALTWVTVGPRVLRGAHALVTRGLTVEVLDALAVGLGAARGQAVTAVMTDTLMGGGEYLEATTERHSEEILEDLLTPHPHAVWVERDGSACEVPFETVAEGDVVLVTAGELVAVDGTVLDGTALVNQASVTGESVPVRKEAGAQVIAGSVLESGRLRLKAEQVGDATTTARIASFIRDSLTASTETERVAEKYADKRVAFTVGLGVITFLLTRDINRLVSVFLIDYACAIKLSAPVAIRSTMAQGAKRGVLIKGGPSIEQLSKADTFVFDKTGTLTRGTLTVTDMVPLSPDDWPEERLFTLAASVEEHTRHPIARAIVEEAHRRHVGHISHGDIDVELAHGLKTTVDTKEVLIGSRHFLEDHHGIGFSTFDAVVDRLSAEGKLLLFAAADHRPIGIIGLRDELRPDAIETMQRLRTAGAGDLVLLSGDREARADALGHALGMDRVIAELEPKQKAEIVADLKARGRGVVFVGDGVNDAPALVTANVGISMPQGADIARATADVLLMEDRLAAVADVREAAAQAMRVIRVNFNLAIGINTALFALASLGRLSPVAAAALHNGSTIALLGYALTATRFPKKATQETINRSASS
ncbi:heavy metal translocating P-type ATPase [Amorphus sp. 3PC139-8]|uniref:heavy metal translocating P-type ATPase n=1 Tax=Amorphus sp. 3PC139-8 TaxID=2735676 RepID=UPI00345D9309